MENARYYIFETYCRIHNTISIRFALRVMCTACFNPYSMLAEKLHMEKDRAEAWIVDLIRNAHLDAKIDSKEARRARSWRGSLIQHRALSSCPSPCPTFTRK